MTEYIQGNLATNRYSNHRPAYPQSTEHQSKRKSLQKKDKIRYLAIVFFLVCLAMIITSRYAQIYQMDADIYTIQKEMKQIQIENQQLKQQLEQMQSPENLKLEAEKLGLVPRNTDQVAQILPQLEDNSSLAMTQ